MNGIYWYVSRQKVEALKQAPPARLKEVALKIKAPFVGAGASIELQDSVFRNVEKIRSQLLQGSLAPSFPDLPNSGTSFFAFAGRAQRAVDTGTFWIAMRAEAAALLLAGSVANAIGGPKTDDQHRSATADPIGAIRRAFDESVPSDSPLGVAEACSYVWTTVAERAGNAWDLLPWAEGIAVYGQTYPFSGSVS
jgi:hypothetical protein